MSMEHDALQAAIHSLKGREATALAHHPIVQVVSDALIADVRSRVGELDAAGELQIRQTVLQLYQEAQQPSEQPAETPVPSAEEYRRALTFTGTIETAQDARDALGALFQGHPQIKLLENGGFEVIANSDLFVEVDTADVPILVEILRQSGFEATEQDGGFATNAPNDLILDFAKRISFVRAQMGRENAA